MLDACRDIMHTRKKTQIHNEAPLNATAGTPYPIQEPNVLGTTLHSFLFPPRKIPSLAVVPLQRVPLSSTPTHAVDFILRHGTGHNHTATVAQQLHYQQLIVRLHA